MRMPLDSARGHEPVERARPVTLTNLFRRGVKAAQRPLKPSGAGAEPAAGAKLFGIKPQ